MQEVELKIGNIALRLSYEDPKKLLDLTNQLNKRVETLKQNNNLSDAKAIFITAIYLLDEIESINKELQKLKVNFYDKFESEKEKLVKNYEAIIGKIQDVTSQLEK
ncbi:cell division protein ZapA [Candidatus Bandiella euplotis]|uniref:Cell division protein ZapA domain protein n=1 Tax=Candidatus Bandiella euplotis TaxID=1664265 RepID=A0ABZ0UK23_9RICK|nr:cell division protein ZapA [Candidatus Bandiella woodruffii]WPX96460.1 Putative cell division protein ZapA domain protein [Candidatus Bandiella woodruffii]